MKNYVFQDLQQDPIEEPLYKEQLCRVAPPTQNEYFEVETILYSKKFKGELYHMCKFLYYPKKFNMFIKDKDLVKGK